ncbi:NLR family CARD domain-containing protein 3-like [Engraulis encrasicolus]|uniref:NLR family CARD domain-containing protein 3-like n=1 Tax=Engraulis encrasicolus TaxID=184585 RepID=UPI002FD56779
MQQAHKSRLLKTSQCLMEGLTLQGIPTLLREIYTDLYITQGGRGEVNQEHEVRQIERASWREVGEDEDSDDLEEDDNVYALEEDEDSDDLEGEDEEHEVRQIKDAAAKNRPIKCSDIFERLSKQVKPSSKKVKPSSKQVKPMGIVLTKGVAGIGKTVSVQKLILDWAEGTSNQDVDFIFPLPFRELNLMKEKTISLVDLVKHFFSEVKDPRVLTSSEKKLMFIFDGLDECRLPLNFSSNPECCDVTKSVPVDVLLTNLLQGNLLPSALRWITTRPAAAGLIPPKRVKQVTEIRGFNDPQKEEYFRKKLSDESLVSRIIAHLKSSRSLYIMCHIPVFSWISATVVENTSYESGRVEMPRTLTQMYTHFLIIQVTNKNTKYTEHEGRDEGMILKLGKLAFKQLQKGNLIFYDEDLRECGIDVTEASVYSGVCTQIFREEAGLYQAKVFSFVHLSIQEFLAALYVFLCFINSERNMSDQQLLSQLSGLFRAATLQDLHKTAVDLALQSRNGHLDLFLRFLLGLSLESNQNLLRHLMPQNNSQSQSSEPTVQLVKRNIRDFSNSGSSRYQSGSDRQINLFYCLNELNQHTVVEHIDRTSGTLSVVMLLPGQWETREFRFETSEEYLEGFNLQTYIKTPEMDQTELLIPDDILQKLTDVFTSSTSAQ